MRLKSISQGVVHLVAVIAVYYLIESDKENVMATGPQNQKRPADVIGCAVAVARLSVGETSESTKEPSGRVRSGHAGAKARAESLTAEQRREIGRKGAAARWA